MRLRTRLISLLGFLAAVLITSLWLFYAYTEELRAYVLQPAIEAYFVLRYYLEFVPQLFLWLIPLIGVSVIMIRRVLRKPRTAQATGSQRAQTIVPGEGELARLTRSIHRARHSRFARVRVSRTLVEIAARLIAGRNGRSLRQARQDLAGGYWRSAEDVHHFLIPRRHYTARQAGHDFEQSLRQAVEHLEAFDQDV